jgi:hypothetical protein
MCMKRTKRFDTNRTFISAQLGMNSVGYRDGAGRLPGMEDSSGLEDMVIALACLPLFMLESAPDGQMSKFHINFMGAGLKVSRT